jgi:hypothetical protein
MKALTTLLATLIDATQYLAGEATKYVEQTAAKIAKACGFTEDFRLAGVYDVECVDANGQEVWRDTFDNLVVTVGKNLALDTILAGSGYTAASYLGLTQTAPTANAADTMSSHAGWVECGNAAAPTYSGNRATPSWSAAANGSKTMSAASAFSITSNGTVGGCFLVYGPSASNAIGNTSGTLFSCGAFTGGDRTVQTGDTLNVTYTCNA